MAKVRQIVAMGGGSFGASPDHPLLERYVLSLTRRKRPRVCFIGTATGDADTYVARFYATFTKLGCIPTHLSLFTRTPDVEKTLLAQDVIYVGGGNTKSMLAVWAEWNLPRILRLAWRRGIILTGVSAGAICWFDHGVTDSWAGHLAPLECLGFLPGACCPHYDSEKDRRPSLQRFVATGALPNAIALDDGAAAHFVGRQLRRVVVARPNALGYTVRKFGKASIEEPVDVERLNARGRVR
jgi:dipeptidase E